MNAKFSTSRGILRRFIEENEAQLFTLTARDAVAGELENTVFAIETPAKLFDIRKVKVVADTTGNQIAEAGKLTAMIDRFKGEEDAWYDDALIADMIALAKKTGDVTTNPVALRASEYDQVNFWTSHFGGIYIFRGVDHPAAITVEPKETLGPMPIEYVFDLGDRNQIAKFLEINGLVEPIVMARGADPGAIIRQKMDFILVDAASALGHRHVHGDAARPADGGECAGAAPAGGVSGSGGAAALGRGGRGLATDHVGPSVVFLFAAGDGASGP